MILWNWLLLFFSLLYAHIGCTNNNINSDSFCCFLFVGVPSQEEIPPKFFIDLKILTCLIPTHIYDVHHLVFMALCTFLGECPYLLIFEYVCMLVHLTTWQSCVQHGALGGSWAAREGRPGFITAAQTNWFFMPKMFT